MQENEEQTGDAARAFEDLRAEVSILRRAVEALPEEWEANQPPDYTESLGQITQGLSKVAGRLQVIEQHLGQQVHVGALIVDDHDGGPRRRVRSRGRLDGGGRGGNGVRMTGAGQDATRKALAHFYPVLS